MSISVELIVLFVQRTPHADVELHVHIDYKGHVGGSNLLRFTHLENC